MGFLPYEESVDYVEPVKAKPSTKKKWWDEANQTWRDTSIWRVPHTRDAAEWLTENHGGPNYDFSANYQGWTIIAGYLWMSEPIYLFYALKFND
jgi:hypothetical protein